MLLHEVKYEWLRLTRDWWVLILSIIFCGLCFFAAFNGAKKVSLRASGIAAELSEVEAADNLYKAEIDSVMQGLKAVDARTNPRSVAFIGIRASRVAAMPPAPMAALSTGQSDLYTHTVKPGLFGAPYLLSFSELSNPVQLMFGAFDLAFVLIYLMPLLILAAGYNLLSAEQEQGVTRLVLSQPVSLFGWLFYKMLFRFFFMTVVVGISLALAVTVSGIPWNPSLITVLLLVALYIFFWFMIALIVNASGKASGTNAVTVVSVWVILVLLVPAVISQCAGSLHPVPSRIQMIHQMRTAQAAAEREADKILVGYYRDHPELAPRDTTAQNRYQFYLGYLASQEVVEAAVAPVQQAYQAEMDDQQHFVEWFRFLSPALILQDAFNDVAGTSPRHYTAYRNQVIAFSDTWRSYFLPRMFQNEWMTSQDITQLPSFQYSYHDVRPSYITDLLAILCFVILLTGISVWLYSRKVTFANAVFTG